MISVDGNDAPSVCFSSASLLRPFAAGGAASQIRVQVIEAISRRSPCEMDSSLTAFQANLSGTGEPFSTASSSSDVGEAEPVRKLHVTYDRNFTFPLLVEEREYHTNAHTQAIAYIVIILVLYFSALTVIVVRYMRKERNQFHLPRYLVKKERSPPSPTVSSSFRLNSGRRTMLADGDLADVAQALNTVSNQLVMDAPPQLLLPAAANQPQIGTTAV